MIHPNVGRIGVYDEELESWNGPAGQLMYSLEFYETDRLRDFVRGQVEPDAAARSTERPGPPI